MRPRSATIAQNNLRITVTEKATSEDGEGGNPRGENRGDRGEVGTALIPLLPRARHRIDQGDSSYESSA